VREDSAWSAELVRKPKTWSTMLVASGSEWAERAMHDCEHRAEQLVGGLEMRAVKAVKPVLRKTFATQSELREVRTLLAKLARDRLVRAERARKVEQAI
jgi:hypothetical protein